METDKRVKLDKKLIPCIVIAVILVVVSLLWILESTSLNRRVNELSAEIFQKEKLIDELTTACADAYAEASAKEEAFLAKSAELEELREIRAGLDTRITDLTASVESLTAENTTLSASVESLTAENTALSASVGSLTAERDSLSGQLSEAGKKLTAAEKRAADLAAENSKLSGKDPLDLSGVTEPVCTSAKRFIRLLREQGITYSVTPSSDGSKDVVTISVGSTSAQGLPFSYSVNANFNAASGIMSIRVWNFTEFSPDYTDEVLRLCNKLNSTWLFVRFHADETDSTVTLSYDTYIPDLDSASDTMWSVLQKFSSIVNQAYDELVIFGV